MAHRLISLILAAAALATLGIPHPARANGLVLPPQDWQDRVSGISLEKKQQAFIEYRDGMERMDLSIEHNSPYGSVWIFPVPAEPDHVTAALSTRAWDLDGTDIHLAARQAIKRSFPIVATTQLYPFFALPSLPYRSYEREDSFTKGDSNVTVYSHTERDNVTAEVLNARSADDIRRYLEGNHAIVSGEVVDALEKYSTRLYTYVVSWISEPPEEISYEQLMDLLRSYAQPTYDENAPLQDLAADFVYRRPDAMSALQRDPSYQQDETLPLGKRSIQYLSENPDSAELLHQDIQLDPQVAAKARQALLLAGDQQRFTRPLTLSVTFPAPRPYFPLVLTGAYGDLTVPATIRVAGFVTPQFPEALKPYAAVSYFTDAHWVYRSDAYDDLQAGGFYDEPEPVRTYTRIDFSAPSSAYTDDLWMSNETPDAVRIEAVIVQHITLFRFILLLLTSIIASLLAGAFVSRHTYSSLRRTKRYFIALGIGNGLSIIGLLFVSRGLRNSRFGRRNGFTTPTYASFWGLPPWPYLPLFSFLFIGLNFTAVILLGRILGS